MPTYNGVLNKVSPHRTVLSGNGGQVGVFNGVRPSAYDKWRMSNNGQFYAPPPASSVLYFPGLPASGATIWDYSGNANNGTITGATWKTLPSGLPYLDYDGADDITTVTASATNQDIFAAGGTVIVWFKPDTIGETAGYLFDKGSFSANKGWRIHMTGDTGVACKLQFVKEFDGASDGAWATTNALFTYGIWYCCAITYTDTNVANNPTFYVLSSGAISTLTVGSGLTEALTPIGAAVSDAAVNLTIGNEAGTARTFDGGITLPSAYKSVLSADTISNWINQTKTLFGL